MIRKQIFLVLLLLYLTFPKCALAVSEEEIKFGFYADRQVVASHTILFNDALTKRVSKIGNRIVKALGQRNINYTFRIINDPTINAFSAAGGFIYVNTGLLDVLESKDELAAVLAHEIAHIRNHHQIKFVYAVHRRRIAGEVAGIFLGAALGALGAAALGPAPSPTSPTYTTYIQNRQQIINVANQASVQFGNSIAIAMIKGYGKKQELEADRFAVLYTYKAGYDPHGLVKVFKKLKSIKDKLEYKDRVRTASFVNAKPGLDERMKHAEAIISKVIKNSH